MLARTEWCQAEHPGFVVACALARSPGGRPSSIPGNHLGVFCWTAHVHTWARQDDICEEIADDFLRLRVRGLGYCNYEVFVGRRGYFAGQCEQTVSPSVTCFKTHDNLVRCV